MINAPSPDEDEEAAAADAGAGAGAGAGVGAGAAASAVLDEEDALAAGACGAALPAPSPCCDGSSSATTSGWPSKMVSTRCPSWFDCSREVPGKVTTEIVSAPSLKSGKNVRPVFVAA